MTSPPLSLPSGRRLTPVAEHPVARLNILNTRTRFTDHAGRLISRGERKYHSSDGEPDFSRKAVPFSSHADRRVLDFHEHIFRPDLREIQFFQSNLVPFRKYYSFTFHHRCTKN